MHYVLPSCVINGHNVLTQQLESLETVERKRELLSRRSECKVEIVEEKNKKKEVILL